MTTQELKKEYQRGLKIDRILKKIDEFFLKAFKQGNKKRMAQLDARLNKIRELMYA
jgi:hypothetical protein